MKRRLKVFYVYRLVSAKFPSRNYTGFTADLRQRLLDHNAGKSRFTAPFRPWKLRFYAAFESQSMARQFELYLKSGSGIAFGNKRLW